MRLTTHICCCCIYYCMMSCMLMLAFMCLSVALFSRERPGRESRPHPGMPQRTPRNTPHHPVYVPRQRGSSRRCRDNTIV